MKKLFRYGRANLQLHEGSEGLGSLLKGHIMAKVRSNGVMVPCISKSLLAVRVGPMVQNPTSRAPTRVKSLLPARINGRRLHWGCSGIARHGGLADSKSKFSETTATAVASFVSPRLWRLLAGPLMSPWWALIAPVWPDKTLNSKRSPYGARSTEDAVSGGKCRHCTATFSRLRLSRTSKLFMHRPEAKFPTPRL